MSQERIPEEPSVDLFLRKLDFDGPITSLGQDRVEWFAESIQKRGLQLVCGYCAAFEQKEMPVRALVRGIDRDPDRFNGSYVAGPLIGIGSDGKLREFYGIGVYGMINTTTEPEAA